MGAVSFHLRRREKHLSPLLPDDHQAESITPLCFLLVVSSLASSACPVIACDWPHLSPPVEASIRVGGGEESRPATLTNKMHLPRLRCVFSPRAGSVARPILIVFLLEQSRNWDKQECL